LPVVIVAVVGLAAAAAGGALLAAPPAGDCRHDISSAQALADAVLPTAALEDEPAGPSPVPDVETGPCWITESRLVWPGRPYCY